MAGNKVKPDLRRFAPVLDLNAISDVIGDRGFSKTIEDIAPLAGAF
jgi:beta-N-acetylhexosaminidase